jgi:serine O-acetyltransferase
MLDNLRQDAARMREAKSKAFPWYVVESLLLDSGFQAVVLHRFAHWFKRRRIPFFGPFFARLNLFFTGVDIGPGAEIGPGLRISHGTGLVIGGYAKVGARALLLHEVTIGSPSHGRVREMPEIGDDVFIGAGAKVIGAIRVGDRVTIGSNALVTRDIPSDSRVLARVSIDVQPREPGPPPAAVTEPSAAGGGR